MTTEMHPDQKEDINGKTDEIQIRSGVQFMRTYRCWVFTSGKLGE